ncbi:Mannose-6-phosphate isomerase [Coemansia sp. RSA 1933]|nr:Mannose-6-phosphate isomerase [Coemansia sp. RSA 1933]
MPVVRLSCAVNNYHWGKHGLSSKAAQFAATNPDVSIDANQTYAELWMGTHPSGPSKLFGTQTELSTLVTQDPARALAPGVEHKYGPNLPFLFKVLSIEKALSIQAHPDKTLAAKLHGERPAVYKDGNHKPEMSIALTDFLAMSGFRPLEEIAGFLAAYPEFRALVPRSADTFSDIAKASSGAPVAEKKTQLRNLFSELMTAKAEDVAAQMDILVSRIPPQEADSMSVDALVHRLNAEYPGDVGVFCIFMLNVLQLLPGDAFFMGPNDPHAYISGDCVECMATSDNVVRAGLTPKLRDVPVLVDMLTYEFGTPDAKLLRPVSFAQGANGHSVVYDPPIDEFSVACTRLQPTETETVAPLQGPQILLVAEGNGILQAQNEEPADVLPGFVYFVYPDTEYTLKAADDAPLVTYAALCLE